MVVPAQHDPLFTCSRDPRHMQPDKTMPWPHVRALAPCAAGIALIWHASLIHWGSACDEGEAQPRQSIACAFKLPGAGVGSGGGGGGGRVTRAQLARGLSVRERFRIVAKALLRYEHWHPEFAGLERGRLSKAAA